MKNKCLLVQCISSFEGILIKNTRYSLQDIVYQLPYFLLFYFASTFTSADIIICNFLEPDPTFSEKKILTTKIPYVRQKFFVDAP